MPTWLITTYHFIYAHGFDICEAVLAIIGGLKALFHYTPFENPADKILDAVAIPFKALAAILPSSPPDDSPSSSDGAAK